MKVEYQGLGYSEIRVWAFWARPRVFKLHVSPIPKAESVEVAPRESRSAPRSPCATLPAGLVGFEWVRYGALPKIGVPFAGSLKQGFGYSAVYIGLSLLMETSIRLDPKEEERCSPDEQGRWSYPNPRTWRLCQSLTSLYSVKFPTPPPHNNPPRT